MFASLRGASCRARAALPAHRSKRNGAAESAARGRNRSARARRARTLRTTRAGPRRPWATGCGPPCRRRKLEGAASGPVVTSTPPVECRAAAITLPRSTAQARYAPASSESGAAIILATGVAMMLFSASAARRNAPASARKACGVVVDAKLHGCRGARDVLAFCHSLFEEKDWSWPQPSGLRLRCTGARLRARRHRRPSLSP